MGWCDIAGRFKHVPENIKVVEALTVCSAMRYRPLSVLARAFKQAADYVPGFHAQGLLQKHIGLLSGGQRKRVSDAIEMLKPVTLNVYDGPVAALIVTLLCSFSKAFVLCSVAINLLASDTRYRTVASFRVVRYRHGPLWWASGCLRHATTTDTSGFRTPVGLIGTRVSRTCSVGHRHAEKYCSRL